MLKKIVLCCLSCFIITQSEAQSIKEYIDAHLKIAQELMHEHKMPASIVLAVAIHESAAGKSKVARYLNNHFGVKGNNSNTEIKSSYKDYATVDASFYHFAEFLKAKPAYNKLFDKFSQYDYKGWARGIQRGGYASSKTWANQVIALIKKYELYKYDERPENYVEPVSPPAVKVAKKTSSGSKTTAKKSTLYTVKKGDNLNKLAEARGTTAKALMKKNNLKSSVLQPGQKIRF